MTKKQKEQRAAFNGTLFIVVLALIIGCYVINAISPKTTVVVQQGTPAASIGTKYDTGAFKPFVQYFKHYQIKYIYAGDNWLIDSVALDSSYVQLLNMACDASTSNDEGQNCIISGGDSIKSFFEGLEGLKNSNV